VTLPLLPDFENYRTLFGVEPESVAADKIRDDRGCSMEVRAVPHTRFLTAQLERTTPSLRGLV
jgi:hypothetical protein